MRLKPFEGHGDRTRSGRAGGRHQNELVGDGEQLRHRDARGVCDHEVVPVGRGFEGDGVDGGVALAAVSARIVAGSGWPALPRAGR